MPYGITQCYLPPGRGDIPTFIPVKLVLDLATLDESKGELTLDCCVCLCNVISVLVQDLLENC